MAQPQKQATSILLCLIAVALTFLGGSWWITKHFCSENEASSAESAGSAVPQDSEAIIDKLVELRRQLNRVKAYCSPRGIEAETIERYRNALRQAILELQSDGLDNTSSSEIATALDALARGETRPIEAILERGARREALPNAKRALADLRLGAIQSARDLQAAERTYRKATQLDPLLAEAWYQLGGVLEARLNWKGAHDAYLEGLDAVRDERGRGIVYWKLGHVTLEQGAHDGAIAYLNKAEEIFRALDEKPCARSRTSTWAPRTSGGR